MCLSPVLESQTQLGADLKPRPTLILTPPTIHYDALDYITPELFYITLDHYALDFIALDYIIQDYIALD